MHSAVLCSVCTATPFIQVSGRTLRVALRTHLSATFMTFSKQEIQQTTGMTFYYAGIRQHAVFRAVRTCKQQIHSL